MKFFIPPPLVFLIAIALSWAIGRLLPASHVGPQLVSTIGFAVVFLGGLVLLLANAGFIARRTTVNPLQPEKASALVTNGVFAFSRNPMYLGMAIVAFGAAMIMRQPLGLVMLAGAIAYINHFQIRPEEAALREKFGADYDAYCAKVRRWI